MSITRGQVADLREGDVVEVVDDRYPDVVTRGPLNDDDGSLYLGNVRAIRWDDGQVPASGQRCTLTVVSRAPRPLHDCPDCTHVDDPLAWVVAGTDPAPPGVSEADGPRYCAESHEGLCCTRETGHPGQHIAGTGKGQRVAAVWS